MREHGTPLYAYDGTEIRRRVASLRDVLERHGLTPRIYYAMKANRFATVLAVFRADGHVGIDASSPREVEFARSAGFSPAEISVTASCLSARDLEYFATSGVHVNLDTISAIVRYAECEPRLKQIGIRIDTGIEVGYGVNAKTAYAGGKLGLAPEEFDAAVQAATEGGLIVDTLHTHLGWGLRASDEGDVARAFACIADLARRVPALREINVGGGLGGRLVEADAPLDPETWAAVVARAFASLNVRIACEPGTYLVAEAGVLIVEVASVWDKQGVHWAGVDASFATNVYAAHYALPLEIIPAQRSLADRDRAYSIAGNINESGDVFARDLALPVLTAGEHLVFFPAGAYGSSMSSDHCLRGNFTEVLVR